MEPPPIVCTIGGMPGMSVPFAAQSARPLTMLSVASVTMNGCGTRPYTKISPFAAPTASPVPRIAAMVRTLEPVSLEDDRADDARERDRRADGEVDPARHDHEQLAEREDGDHRSLGEDVADVPRREEHRRRQADDDDQQEQDQRRARAQGEEAALEEAVAIEAEDSAGHRALFRLRRGHRHLPPTPISTRDQTGPSGNACSSSEAGSISML